MNKQCVVRLCYMCNCRDFSKKKKKTLWRCVVCLCYIELCNCRDFSDLKKKKF